MNRPWLQPLAVKASDSLSVKIDKTKTFEIVASDKDGEKNGVITVIAREVVIKAIPEINARIWADPRDIEINGYTTLNWQCENAESIRIKGIEGLDEVKSTGSYKIKLTETATFEIVASNNVSTKHATAEVNVHRRRLIFQPSRQLPNYLEQAIRPEVENFFRSRDYEIIESRTSTFNSSTIPAADYAVSCEVTISGWQDQGINTPLVSIRRYKLEAVVTISLIRMKDHYAVDTKTSKGSVSAVAFRTRYGEFSTSIEASSKEMEATQKATREALAQLSL